MRYDVAMKSGNEPMTELSFEEILQVAGGLLWGYGGRSCNVEIEGESWLDNAVRQFSWGC